VRAVAVRLPIFGVERAPVARRGQFAPEGTKGRDDAHVLRVHTPTGVIQSLGRPHPCGDVARSPPLRCVAARLSGELRGSRERSGKAGGVPLPPEGGGGDAGRPRVLRKGCAASILGGADEGLLTRPSVARIDDETAAGSNLGSTDCGTVLSRNALVALS
jgi:hypothetical protein